MVKGNIFRDSVDSCISVGLGNANYKNKTINPIIDKFLSSPFNLMSNHCKNSEDGVLHIDPHTYSKPTTSDSSKGVTPISTNIGKE